MQENDWLKSNSAYNMLRYLKKAREKKTLGIPLSDRKLRLFAVAIWHTRQGPYYRNVDSYHLFGRNVDSYHLFGRDVADCAERIADGLPAVWVKKFPFEYYPLDESALVAAERMHDGHGAADILRDIFGNPFRIPCWPCPCGREVPVTDWSRWYRCDNCGELQGDVASSLVRRLANTCYKERNEDGPFVRTR